MSPPPPPRARLVGPAVSRVVAGRPLSPGAASEHVRVVPPDVPTLYRAERDSCGKLLKRFDMYVSIINAGEAVVVVAGKTVLPTSRARGGRKREGRRDRAGLCSWLDFAPHEPSSWGAARGKREGRRDRAGVCSWLDFAAHEPSSWGAVRGKREGRRDRAGVCSWLDCAPHEPSSWGAARGKRAGGWTKGAGCGRRSSCLDVLPTSRARGGRAREERGRRDRAGCVAGKTVLPTSRARGAAAREERRTARRRSRNWSAIRTIASTGGSPRSSRRSSARRSFWNRPRVRRLLDRPSPSRYGVGV